MDENTRAVMKTLSALYVEDEQGIREQLLDSFKRKFKTVHIATNGQEGLEQYKALKPDLIITDLKMPKMDGLSMIEAIRKIDDYIPIVVITAYSDLENLKRAVELDVDRFIQKPPSKSEMDKALYKATMAILKQKEIEDRDQIIRTILGWKPYFSIICSDNDIQHVTSNFLGLMGYSNKKEFLNELQNMEWQTGEGEQPTFNDTKELFTYLDKESEKQHFVVLENRNNRGKERFEVRARYFEYTKLYLLSLFAEAKA